MKPATLYRMCLLSVAVWCSLPAMSWAHRPTVYGGIALPGVGLQIGVGRPGYYYAGHRHRHYRPYAVVAPLFYPPVVYAPPVLVYPAPPVLYEAPVVAPPATATLQILVAPLQVDIYLDGRYLGRAEEFRDGHVHLSVSPGRHTVELRFGTLVHTHTVTVGAGAVTVVNDRFS
ncbi:MAG: hypothetical protein AB7N91_26860 [Candidatus Tectimicrobiota bacterium]